MDRQFEPSRGEPFLLKIGTNTVSEGDHVLEIEEIKSKRKKRVFTTYNDLKRHLTKFSGVLIREMVYTDFFG